MRKPASAFVHPGLEGAGPLRRARDRGAALLLAMIILTLIVTLAAGMVWQHTRAFQVEAAERARTQSAWILSGALDWARLILREDMRQQGDHLGEPWAVPLAEARLSTFIAADAAGVADADVQGPDAFLSGTITDAQAKWNLRNLLKPADNEIDPAQRQTLERLCAEASLSGDVAQRLAEAYQKAVAGAPGASIEPRSMRDLVWLGLEPREVAQLQNMVTLLPKPTKLNINTASQEVLAAALPGSSAGLAQMIVEQRKREPFRNVGALQRLVGAADFPKVQPLVDVSTQYFEVRGRLRLDERALEEASIVERSAGLRVLAISRERINQIDAAR